MAQCITPIDIRNPKAEKDKREKRFIQVPCGKCPPCIKRRVQGWMFRLKKEQEVSTSSVFLTLTYDDSYLPFSDNGLMTLDKRDHQLFMKKLRKHLSVYHQKYSYVDSIPLKYYAIGEYGDNTHRPHFHYILFNLPDRLIVDESIITSIWDKGLVQVAICNDNTIAYVTGYVNKKIYADKKVGIDPDDDRIPECSMMSKGLGKNFLTKRTMKFYNELMAPYIVQENGQKVPMPRYFRHKIYTEAQRLIVNQKAKEYIENNEQYRDTKHEIEHKSHIINQFKRQQKLKHKSI